MHPYTHLLPSAPDVSSWAVRTEFECKSIKFVLYFSKNVCCKLERFLLCSWSSFEVYQKGVCLKHHSIVSWLSPSFFCLRTPGRLMYWSYSGCRCMLKWVIALAHGITGDVCIWQSLLGGWMFLEGLISQLDVFFWVLRGNEKPFPWRTDAHQITRQGMLSAYKAGAAQGEAVTALTFQVLLFEAPGCFALQLGIVTTVIYSWD